MNTPLKTTLLCVLISVVFLTTSCRNDDDLGAPTNVAPHKFIDNFQSADHLEFAELLDMIMNQRVQALEYKFQMSLSFNADDINNNIPWYGENKVIPRYTYTFIYNYVEGLSKEGEV